MAEPRVHTSGGSEDEGAARVLVPLLSRVNTPQLRLSYAAALIFIEALRVAPYKRKETEIISSTTVVLVAALMAIGLAENYPVAQKAELAENYERENLRRWGQTLRTRGHDTAIVEMAR